MDITIIDTFPDATALVMAENRFNDPPASGHQFYMVKVRVKYLGSGSLKFEVPDFKVVGQSAVVRTTYGDSCGVIPDELPEPELFTGGQIEGWLCWQILEADQDSLELFWDFPKVRFWFSLEGAPQRSIPAPVPTPTVTPRPTATPAPIPSVPTIEGDWTYFGPECPDYREPGFDGSCAYSDTSQFLALDAYDDTNESFYDDAGLRVSCFLGRDSPSFTFDGGGPWIALGETSLNIRFENQAARDGPFYHTDKGSDDLERVWFNSRDTEAILRFLEDADRQDKDVTMGAVSDYATVVAYFDVTGFTANFHLLPCS